MYQILKTTLDNSNVQILRIAACSIFFSWLETPQQARNEARDTRNEARGTGNEARGTGNEARVLGFGVVCDLLYC